MNALKNLTRGLLLYSSGLALMAAAGPYLKRRAMERLLYGSPLYADPGRPLVEQEVDPLFERDHDHNTRKQE